jgi:hypothetical protein
MPRAQSATEEADALLAAGHLQQFAVERLVPMPGEARLGKGGVEGRTMAVAFRIGQRAIDIEDKGFKHGCQHSVAAPISASHSFLWR